MVQAVRAQRPRDPEPYTGRHPKYADKITDFLVQAVEDSNFLSAPSIDWWIKPLEAGDKDTVLELLVLHLRRKTPFEHWLYVGRGQ